MTKLNVRLSKLEEAENANLNAEYLRLTGILRTGFSEAEKLEICRANDIQTQPATREECEATKREFLNHTDLAHKRDVVEGLQRIIEKWQTCLRQRAVNPDWDSSGLNDPLFQQTTQNGDDTKCSKMQQT
jgi:hypothetical protein